MWSQTNICNVLLLLQRTPWTVSGGTLKIGSFQKLQSAFPQWHNPLFSKMKEEFYSNEIKSNDTKFMTGSFPLHLAIGGSRYYG